MTTKVEKTITVDVPISTAYNQWTQFEDFPEFMSGVQQVEQLDDMRLHWVAEIAGVKREWYATIVDQRPDEKVAWAAAEGATNAGAVYFTPIGAGSTSVTLELEYEPEGIVEKVGDTLSIVDKQAQSDLERFKQFIESRQDATGAWRGDAGGQTDGTPGAEAAAQSQGDDGKSGISGKVAVAGAAAAAVGVAAAAALRSGSDEDEADATSAQPTYPQATQPIRTEMVPVDVTEIPPVVVDEGLTSSTRPSAGPLDLPDDAYGTTPRSGDQHLAHDVQLDSTTPGITNENDGRA